MLQEHAQRGHRVQAGESMQDATSGNARRIEVSTAAGRQLTFQRDEGAAKVREEHGIARVEIVAGRAGWETLVFLTDPARSRLAVRPDPGSDSQLPSGSPRVLEVRAVLPCHFSSAEVVLAVDFDCVTCSLTRLEVGEVSLLDTDLSKGGIGRHRCCGCAVGARSIPTSPTRRGASRSRCSTARSRATMAA
jgi:hypothetical protein